MTQNNNIRTFLVKEDIDLNEIIGTNAESTTYKCGYFSMDGSKKVKIDIIGDSKAYLTSIYDSKIKNDEVICFEVKAGEKRSDYYKFKHQIPVEEAENMLDLFYSKKYKRIEKNVNSIDCKGNYWIIESYTDVFNNDLVLAKAEIDDKNSVNNLPDWIEKEVTDDPRFFDENLLCTPYNTIKFKEINEKYQNYFNLLMNNIVNFALSNNNKVKIGKIEYDVSIISEYDEYGVDMIKYISFSYQRKSQDYIPVVQFEIENKYSIEFFVKIKDFDYEAKAVNITECDLYYLLKYEDEPTSQLSNNFFFLNDFVKEHNIKDDLQLQFEKEISKYI